jgi:UDP-N-acetylmuramate dehydrogenase
MPTTADKLRERFGSQFKPDEPLAKHVNFRIGGPAKYFVEARSTQDLIDVVRLAHELSLPYFILGGGSNTLVADEGYQGLVIKAANRNTRIEGDRVTAEAGVISATVARATADKGLRGFEWAISLPGTIGGAVRGNAGCFGGEVKDTLESVKLLRDGEVIDVPVADMHYGYRHSLLKEPGHSQDVVLEATFKLKPGDRTEAMAQIDKNLAGRKASQPLGSSSAGCMFKNYEFKTEDEILKIKNRTAIPEAMLAAHRIGAGWMIDQLGLKGTKMGEAQIAPQHGNFLLNVGHATAKDIVTLISFVKAKARDEFGVQLHEEVQYLGF